MLLCQPNLGIEGLERHVSTRHAASTIRGIDSLRVAKVEIDRRFSLRLMGVPFYWLSNAGTIALNSAKYTMPGLIMCLGA